MNKIVLASTSETRHFLLKRLLSDFSSDTPECKEIQLADEKPYDMAKRLAQLKARSLKNRYPKHLIIGSDQVATIDNVTPIGKPLTNNIAFEQLKASSNRLVYFHTSLCLLNTLTGNEQLDVVTTKVQFRTLTDQQIKSYITSEDVRFCAGSFKVEQKGISLFQSLECPDPTSLIGLPLIRLTEFLQAEEIDPLLF